jgi:hypothetical protein
MEKTEGNLHWQIVQNLMEGFDEDRALTEIADDICSLLSQHIKAKALTDEQINELHIKHGQLFREKWEIFKSTSTMTGLDYAKSIESIPTWDKYLAAAQLQAALKELGSK